MSKKDSENKVQYLPIGMCLGLSIGMAIGAAMDNIPIGMCFGMGIGMCFGSAMDNAKRAKEEKPEEFPPAEYMQMLKEIQVVGHQLHMNALRADSLGLPDSKRYWDTVDRFQEQFSIFLHQFIKID